MSVTSIDLGNFCGASRADLEAIADILDSTAHSLRCQWIKIQHGDCPVLFDASRALNRTAEEVRERVMELAAAEAAPRYVDNVVAFRAT